MTRNIVNKSNIMNPDNKCTIMKIHFYRLSNYRDYRKYNHVYGGIHQVRIQYDRENGVAMRIDICIRVQIL